MAELERDNTKDSFPKKATEKKLFGTQPPKKATYVALKSCEVRFEDALIILVEGKEISGLTAPEANYLKRFKFIKAVSTPSSERDEGRDK